VQRPALRPPKPTPTTVKPSRQEAPRTTQRLANGFSLIEHHRPRAGLCAVGFYSPSPARVSGAELLARELWLAQQQRAQLAARPALSERGLWLDDRSTEDALWWVIAGPCEAQSFAVETLSAWLSAPLREPSADERAALLRRLQLRPSQPWERVSRVLQPAPRLPSTEEAREWIDTIQTTELQRARQHWLDPQQSALSLVGPERPSEAREIAVRVFSAWTNAAPNAAPSTTPETSAAPRCVIEIPGLEKVIVGYSWEGSETSLAVLSYHAQKAWKVSPEKALRLEHLGENARARWVSEAPLDKAAARFMDFSRRAALSPQEPAQQAAQARGERESAEQFSPTPNAAAWLAKRASDEARPAPQSLPGTVREGLVIAGPKEALAPFRRELSGLSACPE
jgi:hypothetical protein